jgi:hypothetical protein
MAERARAPFHAALEPADHFAVGDNRSDAAAEFIVVFDHFAARQPTPQEAADLGQPRMAPVLVWVSVNAIPDGRPINYDSSVFAAARVSIVIDDEE